MIYYKSFQDGGFNLSFFDPQIEQQFLQTTAARQHRFDQAVGMTSEALARLGETETYNPALLQSRVGKVQEDISRIVQDKYGGDYGAAANEITRRLSSERRDPFYQLNRMQVEQGKAFEQARLQNPDRFIPVQDPTTIDVNQVTDPTQLRAEYRLRTDLPDYIRKNLSAAGQAAIEKIAKKSLLPGYNQIIKEKGLGALSEKDWDEVLSDQDVQRYLAESTHMIDPNISTEAKTLDGAKSYLRDAINSIYGTQLQSQFVRDLTFTTDKNQQLPASTSLANVAVRGIEGTGTFADYSDWRSTDIGGTGVKQLSKRAMLDNLSSELFKDDRFKDIQQLGTPEQLMALAATPEKLSRGFVTDAAINELVANSDVSTLTPELRNAINDYRATYSPSLKVAKKSKVAKLATDAGLIDTESINTTVAQGEKIKKFNDELVKKVKEQIFKENADLLGRFKTFDIFTPDAKVNKLTKDRMSDLDNFVSEKLDLVDFAFEQSDNADIDFTNQDELREDKDENYEHARKDKKFKINGIAVDPRHGIKLLVETENKNGTVTTHIASPASQETAERVLAAYNNPQMTKDYVVATLVNEGNTYINSLTEGIAGNLPQETLNRIATTVNLLKQNPMATYNDVIADLERTNRRAAASVKAALKSQGIPTNYRVRYGR